LKIESFFKKRSRKLL